MRGILLLLGLFSFPFEAVAQEEPKSEREKLVYEYYDKGIKLRSTERDSSYYYFEKAFEYARDLKNYSDALELLISSMLTSGHHYDLKKFAETLGVMELFLRRDSIRSSIDDIAYYDNRLTYEYANYWYKLKKYDLAKSNFTRLHDSLVQQPIDSLDSFDYTTLIHTTNFLALIYLNTGKFDLSESYFNRSLAFLKKYPKKDSNELRTATLHLMARLYSLTGRFFEAQKMLESILDDFKTAYSDDLTYKNNILAAYLKLTENSMAQDSLARALHYLDESQTYLNDKDPFYKQSLLMHGDIRLEQGEYPLAEESYHKALRAFSAYRHHEPHQDIAEVLGKLAQLSIKKKDYKKGLRFIQRALENSGADIAIRTNVDNPAPDDVFSKRQLLHLLDLKSRLLHQAYDTTGESRYFEMALRTAKDLLNTFDRLKMEFDSKLDKQFLAEKGYPIFHRMLQLVHSIHEKNPSPEIVQLALNIAEKNKDFLLLEALRGAQANRYGDVPRQVLDREAQLRAEITHVEKEIFDATETASGFSEELFHLKQEYYSFLDTIKTKYPKYHGLKYRTASLNLAEIRDELLKDNGTLISYTLTDDYLYGIVLNGSRENFLKVPFSEGDREAIREFYKVLSVPTINDSQKAISDLGKALYDKILRKPLEGFGSKSLTIIPDGELHYLPFDLLRENGAYLLETKRIGYGNSVASLLELKQKKSSEKNKVLAFAPSFSEAVALNGDRQFGKLRYNDDEVAKIGAFYDTETVLDERATLASFRARKSDYNIFHLATHASANDAYPDYSYLAFTETRDSAVSNILYTKDLYAISLNADMVTLSACQTGIGKLQKGQGMLSLSKGFYYAGAKSLVNTLWKINDKSSVKLMEYFYEGLGEGKSKSAALRDAKLKYLETTEDDLLRHPYYWAAFVVSGDVSPISETHYWWYVGAAALFFILLSLMSRSRRGQKEFRRIVVRGTS